MTVGLKLVCSELFYGGQLKPGQTTAIDHPSREISKKWHKQMHLLHPSLKKEPQGSKYPVLLNVTAKSEQEPS